MNPPLLPRALTVGLLAIVISLVTSLSPGRAQTVLDKVSFGTNWVAEAEHGGFFQAGPMAPTRPTGLTSPSCRAARTTITACC